MPNGTNCDECGEYIPFPFSDWPSPEKLALHTANCAWANGFRDPTEVSEVSGVNMNRRCSSCSRNLSFHPVDWKDPRAQAEHDADCRWLRQQRASHPPTVGLAWLLNELAGKKFPNKDEAYDFIKKRLETEREEQIAEAAEALMKDSRVGTRELPLPQDGKLTKPVRDMIVPGTVLRMVNSDGTVAPYSDATVLRVGAESITVVRPFMHVIPWRPVYRHVDSAGKEKLEVTWKNLLADKTPWRVVLTARGNPHQYISNG